MKWNWRKGGSIFIEGLNINRSLKFLDISCNKIPEGLTTEIKERIE